MTTAAAPVLEDLAALVVFPRSDVAPRARQCAVAMSAWCPEAAVDLERFAGVVAHISLPVMQEIYTAVFDFDPACALELGWHLYGEAFERGRFLADIREDLAREGVNETSGLPDHLAHVLALLGREDPARARALAAVVAPAIGAVLAALAERRSPYLDLLAAVDKAVAAIAAAPPQEATNP